MEKNKLIAISIIKNEQNNYLRHWLENIGQIADYHIFLDDASNDDTPNIIKDHLKKYPGELHLRKTSIFKENEPALRSELWEYTRKIANKGDWILIVDADEFYDSHMVRLKKKILQNKYPNKDVVKVSCLDMWDSTHYRTDGKWSPKKADTRIIRFCDVPFCPNGTSLHMPPYPQSTDIKKNINAFIPKIHAVYLKKSDRERRYQFYKRYVSPDDNPAGYAHALSIMNNDIQKKKYFSRIRDLLSFLIDDKLYFQIKNYFSQINCIGED